MHSMDGSLGFKRIVSGSHACAGYLYLKGPQHDTYFQVGYDRELK